MLKFVLPAFAGVLLLASCGGTEEQKNTTEVKKDSVVVKDKDCKTYHLQAVRADSVLINATNHNAVDAEKALLAFNAFASFCKDDSLAPIFLLKGGQVAQSINKFTQAQVMFNQCIDNYPFFRNRAAAMFLLAQLYDDPKMLNDEPAAKELYEKLIRWYPKTSYASDARACLLHLGKTDEQLVQEFLKKNKGK